MLVLTPVTGDCVRERCDLRRADVTAGGNGGATGPDKSSSSPASASAGESLRLLRNLFDCRRDAAVGFVLVEGATASTSVSFTSGLTASSIASGLSSDLSISDSLSSVTSARARRLPRVMRPARARAGLDVLTDGAGFGVSRAFCCSRRRDLG